MSVYGFDAGDVSRIFQHETSSMADSDARLTAAEERKAKADKEQRIRDSGKRSLGQKLLSAAARGAAAYFTGGLSETMGGGDFIDQAMLGTDSEGRAVRNEYGNLVGVASRVGQGMSTQNVASAANALKMQSQKDDAMQTKLDQLDPTGKLGFDFAQERAIKDKNNYDKLQAYKDRGFLGAFSRPDDLDTSPTKVGSFESLTGPKLNIESKQLSLDDQGSEVGSGTNSRSNMYTSISKPTIDPNMDKVGLMQRHNKKVFDKTVAEAEKKQDENIARLGLKNQDREEELRKGVY